MLYSIIETKLGEKQGLNPRLHRLTAKGTKMVVNENELLAVNPDIAEAAMTLGGTLLNEAETMNELKHTDK
ncbi:MAG: hypothetical protein IJ640_08550 [Prevotella sp.]|nr:hypothetical protein [Prevotella sp.]